MQNVNIVTMSYNAKLKILKTSPLVQVTD